MTTATITAAQLSEIIQGEIALPVSDADDEGARGDRPGASVRMLSESTNGKAEAVGADDIGDSEARAGAVDPATAGARKDGELVGVCVV